ncbi:putative glutamine ABC transporter permease protein GlnM [Achromobacter mucicolens]|uniref:amino acid ABC transporter permease n=1 Tax=Achromobacter mucicolens TaxID=1389922 RepID=UPI0009C5878A|nr:amino acid ABC transporter permease [Achromobacter mucicolens]MDG9967800.1 amino acid ABC transporter permease [Achromobacter mucicolens]OXC87867.1 amino acid ABC transporter [Achromobacter sp. KAs 3-5]WBX87566.1 amino acid ABC transporter permease [Achromobacter mucicolens]CAB3677187.1 putative glutamine ABC transporter permease protein GlnM [Achromobacter mucicolens]
MTESLLEGWVAFARPFGLNYAFVLDAGERVAFVRGLWVTLQLCAASIPVSLVFGVLIAAGLTSGRAWLTRPLTAFVELTRNTPTLVQLYCAFLVLNMLISQKLEGGNPITPFMWVVLVVALHKAVFHAEALRAGIEAVPGVTLEAARSLAFSRGEILWRVQLPLALRFALPALVNNLVDLVKMTAIASAIAVGDVTYESIMIWSQRDNVLELLLLILLYFGLLTWVVSVAGRWLENRLRMPGYGQ